MRRSGATAGAPPRRALRRRTWATRPCPFASSPGDEGPVTQLNDASAVADAGGSASGTRPLSRTAYATRPSRFVASPGSAAQVSQQSEANAEGSTAVAVTTDSVDTALTVTVAGPDLERPGPAGLVIWEWTWTWQGDEAIVSST